MTNKENMKKCIDVDVKTEKLKLSDLLYHFNNSGEICIKSLCDMASCLYDLKIDTHTELLNLTIEEEVINLIINIKTKLIILISDGDYYLFYNSDIGYKNLDEFRNQYKANVENDLTYKTECKLCNISMYGLNKRGYCEACETDIRNGTLSEDLCELHEKCEEERKAFIYGKK